MTGTRLRKPQCAIAHRRFAAISRNSAVLGGARELSRARLHYRGLGPVFSGAFNAKVAAGSPILTFAIDDKGRPVDPAKAEGVCKVKLALVGPLLLVHDEGCVGAGSAVTFEGAYTKAKR